MLKLKLIHALEPRFGPDFPHYITCISFHYILIIAKMINIFDFSLTAGDIIIQIGFGETSSHARVISTHYLIMMPTCVVFPWFQFRYFLIACFLLLTSSYFYVDLICDETDENAWYQREISSVCSN